MIQPFFAEFTQKSKLPNHNPTGQNKVSKNRATDYIIPAARIQNNAQEKPIVQDARYRDTAPYNSCVFADYGTNGRDINCAFINIIKRIGAMHRSFQIYIK